MLVNPLFLSFLKQRIETLAAMIETAPTADPQITAVFGLPDLAVAHGVSVGLAVAVGSGKSVFLKKRSEKRKKNIS